MERLLLISARATSAAPRMFKPFHHEPSKQVYVDGAIYHNNPVQIADKERKILWLSMQAEYPDVWASIGTSYGPPRSDKELTSAPPQVGVWSHGKSLYKLAIDHIASALDSEKAWDDYISTLQPPIEKPSRYVRLNPQLHVDPPSLDNVDCMQRIKTTVRTQMMNDHRIPLLALQLVASCFYFEKSAAAELQLNDSYECKGEIGTVGNPRRHTKPCTGEIHCRLLPESEEIYELGKLLREKMMPGRNPAFIIQEKYRGQDAISVEISPAVIDRMIGGRRFNLGRITISLSSKLAVTEMFLSVNQGELLPISRFPRSLLEDEGVREST